MALPLTTQTPQGAYASLQQIALVLKNQCSLVQGGNYAANIVAGLLAQSIQLNNAALALNAQTQLNADVIAYVAANQGITTAQVISDFVASLTALQALIAAVIRDYPAVNGICQDRLIDANGNITWVSLPSLPNTLPAIAAWLNTVA